MESSSLPPALNHPGDVKSTTLTRPAAFPASSTAVMTDPGIRSVPFDGGHGHRHRRGCPKTCPSPASHAEPASELLATCKGRHVSSKCRQLWRLDFGTALRLGTAYHLPRCRRGFCCADRCASHRRPVTMIERVRKAGIKVRGVQPLSLPSYQLHTRFVS